MDTGPDLDACAHVDADARHRSSRLADCNRGAYSSTSYSTGNKDATDRNSLRAHTHGNDAAHSHPLAYSYTDGSACTHSYAAPGPKSNSNTYSETCRQDAADHTAETDFDFQARPATKPVR